MKVERTPVEAYADYAREVYNIGIPFSNNIYAFSFPTLPRTIRANIRNATVNAISIPQEVNICSVVFRFVFNTR